LVPTPSRGVSVDFDGAAVDESFFANLRSNVERAAVASVSIAYQIFLAEYHAKRGELDVSRHHSNLAESLLATYPNIWLRGLLDLHLSCLSYLEGNYLDSLVAARHALDTSVLSGHLLTSLTARANMAAAYLAVGQPARARACLASALQQAGSEEQIFGLLLETLAEAQLLSGTWQVVPSPFDAHETLAHGLPSRVQCGTEPGTCVRRSGYFSGLDTGRIRSH